MAGGRPRTFDPVRAVRAAMETFWRQGYDGTSMDELTAAMGMSPSSLYSTFGNKDALFARIVEEYMRGPGSYVEAALDRPTAADVARAMLHGAVAATTGEHTPAGCLTVQGALTAGRSAAGARDVLARRRAESAARLTARLERARDEGDLPADADPAGLARFLGAAAQGIAVQAANGASRAELTALADRFLSAWPA